MSLYAVLQACGEGFVLVFSWPNILYPIVGTGVAMLVSAMPGVSGLTLMALAIPLTLDWEPVPVLLLFGALVGGATFMGSVTAILLNIPGKASNAATLLDGYPMACQGKAKTAIACSALSSALGSSFGVVVLILLLPFMHRAILILGPAELLLLVVWGLTMVAAARGRSLLKSLVLSGLGLLVSFVGFDPRTAESRFTLGAASLHDGLSFVPVFLGIFAVAEMIHQLVQGRNTISGETRIEKLSGSIGEGFSAVFRNFGLFLRCSTIGTVVGMIPGVGGTVAGFVAYGHAVRSAGSERERFGKGDIRGVLAPETANDAKDAGALLPTLAFGIPGGAGTALLLGALTLHGLVPGKELLSTQLSLVFVLIWSLFLSNWITSIVGIACAQPVSRITLVGIDRLAPIVLSFACLGAFAYRSRVSDIFVAFGFGVFGYYLKKFGWPRIAFVIALVLGPLFEGYLFITIRLHELGRIHFWGRPLTLVMVILTGTLLLTLRKKYFPGGARPGDRQ